MMKTLMAPLALNETSYNTARLHQTLEVLGLPVAKKEVEQRTAGPDTLKNVRVLQKRLNVRVDESILVDDATVTAIAEALEKGGFTVAERSFTVSGAMRGQDRSVKKQQSVIAFDIDLRGVVVYQTARTLAELQKNGGFEFLGQTTSDNRGNYSLTFYDWQYRRGERKKADVVVYAITEDKDGARIVGLSRLINSEDYSDDGFVRNLDVLVTETDARTEYVILMEALNAFLKENDTTLRELAASPEQLAFTASELDVKREYINVAAGAELLVQSKGPSTPLTTRQPREQQLSHELLYGIGRQDIELDWPVLFRKHEEELRAAIAKSVAERVIRESSEQALTAFLRALQDNATKQILDDNSAGDGKTLNAMLSNALPKEAQRLSFLNAVATFKGSDFSAFWREHLPAQPEFKDQPKLVSSLLLTQQLALLTGNHQPLINELLVNRKIDSTHQLFDLEKKDWSELLKKTGVPDFVPGQNDEEKVNAYAELLQTLINAAFPTQRIKKMVERNRLPIENKEVGESIARFLSNSAHFDFASSRVHDFEKEIREAVSARSSADDKRKRSRTAARPENLENDPAVEVQVAEAKNELMKIQRVYQVSTTPDAMTGLMKQNLHSAYTIANIPAKSFTKIYGEQLGGEAAAFAIHQRASHIAMRTEMAAMHMMEYSQGLTPSYAMGAEEKANAMAVLQDRIPNYAQLFGSPDLCECEHCRSVYSAAAYFVDLLRFLSRGVSNADNKTPFDMLAERRPDLQFLPLTCENTNTIIPYIDLANEVMEYYTAKDSLNQFRGYDTGGTTAEELRANPQNFNLDAYRKLREAKYPFTLPYHQPLDVIRLYSDHLKVSRYEAMKAMNPLSGPIAANAIPAESLRLSEEEYKILTGFDFAGNPDTVTLNVYFGYTSVAQLEDMTAVREFLRRSGIAYTDLIELVKTRFINPFQSTLEFLQKIFGNSTISSNQLYAKLVNAGTLSPANDPEIVAALDAYNIAHGTAITSSDFALWVTNNFTDFQEVITLFEPNSACNLDTTKLRTIQNIYENSPLSGMDSYWSKIHRFIRLWRKLGWTIHELDLMLAALGQTDITPGTIASLESVVLLQRATKLPLNELAVLWGNIDSYGDKSLYRKLFLNKAAQQIDEAFQPDVEGEYLQGNFNLGAHKSAIVAAFRIREDDLAAILKVARVTDNGPTTLRAIDLATDALNLANLSTIYRYVVLARALKISIPDLCKLIALFDAAPFSTWDIDLNKFSNIAPNETYEFYQLALSTKEAGFKPTLLEYIISGTLPADSKIGLTKEKTLQTAKSIRDAFAVIEQDHPKVAPKPLTPEIIGANLALSYTPEIVSRFLGILDGTAAFEVITDPNLDIFITDSSLFSAKQFTDLGGLITQLIDHTDAVSNFLWKALAPATQLVLQDLNSIDIQRQTALVNGLNNILTGGSIYDSNRFAGITLSPETLGLLTQNPQGADEIRFNRLLLEDAYPLKIAKLFITKKYAYVKSTGRLTCAGIVTDSERVALTSVVNTTPHFVDAVDQLYAAPETFISTYFSSVFSDLPEANRTLLDHPKQATAATFEEKLAYVYDHFMPIVREKLRRDVVTQQLATLIGLTQEATTLLIADDIDPIIAALSAAGFSADYFNDPTWSGSVMHRTDPMIDFSWGLNARDGLAPDKDSFSIRWTAYIAAPASGDYILRVDVEAADEVFKLYLDGTLILEKTGTDVQTSWEISTSLNAAKLHSLILDYSETLDHAGMRLQWKTATTAVKVVPESVACPAAILDQFVADASVYHQAAKFILGFRLSEAELNHFIKNTADFANIDFKALLPAAWKRINNYTTLRDAVPQAQASLTDVFALVHTDPLSTVVADLEGILSQATAWDEVSLQFLVDQFALTRADFKNEIALNRLRQVMQIVGKTGLSAQTIATWGKAVTDFNALNVTAQLLKNTVRAKYEEKDWLDLAGKLNDTIRENQKQALIAYLLTNADIQAWGATNADGLFEYFLIDVQMGACMDTSRIVQANSSVQMFVNRCLLNLESKMSSGSEKGVSPGAIDRKRWEWMKHYRAWEANRKVFLYPENWLEPDWRTDRSEFFKELESYLVQNDITDRSVEQAFRDYLTNLNEVANLEVCGLHKESYKDGKLKYLHVFGRTHNAPYKFFYRTWNEFRKWSAWEKMPLDIRCVENGDDSGVHLLPVVWKNRLFLFWPEFIKVQETPDNNQSIKDTAETKVSQLKAVPGWEIRLSWSEYIDGKWSPKQVCKEFIKLRPADWGLTSESGLRWVYVIDANQELQIRAHCLDNKKPLPVDLWRELGSFNLSDITSRVEAGAYWMSTPLAHVAGDGWKGYGLSFMNYSKDGKLQLAGDDYLRSQVSHNVLVTPTKADYFQTLRDPFFFSDSRRTYFVRPVDISFLEQVQEPERFGPFPGLPAKIKSQSEPSILNDPPVAKRELTSIATEPADVITAGGAGVSIPTTSSPSISFGGDLAHVKSSFGGSLGALNSSWNLTVVHDKGLEFHTFYHPFSSQFVKNLNQGGLSGLMQSDTAIPSDNGSLFKSKYDPNFTNGLVQKPSDFLERTYYKENVCFDVYGANSIYNWELFFHAPLYIAVRLSKNGKFEEAMKWFHYIFDPTTDDLPQDGESPVSRYWKVIPFKTTTGEKLGEWFRQLGASKNKEDDDIREWRDNPFDPHLIASKRPLAYMKHVVIKYVENLIAWGDSLFRQFTMESVNEALQIYVIANDILGPRPESVPKRGEIKAETYDSLKIKLDDFSNALVELENLFPFSSEVPVSQSANGTNLLSVGSALYFCIPPNEKLLDYWDTVADRLFKIRHCQNIDGVEQHLALFSPPIDPAALIQAAAQGLSLGSILADLSSPPPIYRFSFLIQKANEFCSDVKALGSALLSALEKKDGEELSRLRASQETQMLELMTAIKERQVLDAKVGKENLEKARETALFRLQHYIDLLGNESITVPASPSISATLTIDSQLPADTNISTIIPDVDQSLQSSAETGVKLIPREVADLKKSAQAMMSQIMGSGMEAIAGVVNLVPNFAGDVKPFGLGVGTTLGGTNLGAAISALAKVPQITSNILNYEATQAAKMAGYIRREQDWTLQANLAAREIVGLDKQITSADIRVQITQQELENHKQQIENAKATEQFLKNKFTNQELYQWMKEQLFAVYKESYNLAYDMAKKAEKAYKYEMGTELASFIQYGYWDNSKQGLGAGEKLQLALRQLEKSCLEENRRELELSKSISLARLNPLALIELRETGKCHVSVPEELFDLDFPGHYCRRLKGVRLTIPCVIGPYASVSCSLRLLNNSIRINTSMNSESKYEHANDQGLLIDDDRFRTNHTPVTAIATSSAQNDSGMFEFNFRDERYLPFERAGAISEWQIELSTERELRQFDYSTISDVILQLDYTARESGGLFKSKATAYIKEFIRNVAPQPDEPFMQLFDMKHEFPTEWYRFLHPQVVGTEQKLDFTLGKERFPFFVQEHDVVVTQIEVLARCTGNNGYHLHLSYTGAVEEKNLSRINEAVYDELNVATIDLTVPLDIATPVTMKFTTLPLPASTLPDYGKLVKEPPEVEDIYFVLHYKLADMAS